MALKSCWLMQPHLHSIPKLTCCCCCCFKPTNLALKKASQPKTRRGFVVMVAIAASLVLNFNGKLANGLDLELVAPDQTLEEAQSGIRGHALALLQVKAFIDSESWGEAQKALRRSSAYVKQDFYTIIQGRPASERPQLRKLYFDLFNNVTKLDYAARDKDASRVLQCYHNIVMTINDILSRV
ncbi:Oxygen-evolving enhancer protein [Parasponia andersonii]|uniref:Oxygen-evolving enhancer protein n=1 Tax=Parasponia andersonii TaxID=3476 RepID=A0A2P5C6M3_PARAD|nr:Oxygen-evolving enhancer protein [Parasponia andersonii]